MKKHTFKNISIVSICLMGASTIAAAVRPTPKGEDENQAVQIQGISVLSSSGDGDQTAIIGPGDASYTETGLASQGRSATSFDNVGTLTRIVGCDTLDSTTHGDWQDLGCPKY
ncbi:hypothetical protein [Chitinophaga sp. S165]|uniref:hypothetical protein n=1 Tax=Chitinophaga sp. S165 TaxID=2135462 RepID=UPI000D70B59B|nr:hypothetical protein [Chitinophaga sp. S165]PWV51930.1 hypothetical protein C7475_103540 [Chitinophaga sp. S165]